MERMTAEKQEIFFNKPLERALQIMDAFRTDRRELTIGQLSEILGLARATVSRLCTTLVKYDYLKKNPDFKVHPTSQGLTIHLMGCIVVEALPGSIIEFFDDYYNFFFRDVPKISSLGEVFITSFSWRHNLAIRYSRQ